MLPSALSLRHGCRSLAIRSVVRSQESGACPEWQRRVSSSEALESYLYPHCWLNLYDGCSRVWTRNTGIAEQAEMSAHERAWSSNDVDSGDVAHGAHDVLQFTALDRVHLLRYRRPLVRIRQNQHYGGGSLACRRRPPSRPSRRLHAYCCWGVR